MCGIAGMVDWRAATTADALRSIGEAMNDTLRHRGPDGSGVWVEAEGGVALCQRRLAIIDLSPGGAQPMHSADRRYVITFNGEIYNYRDIRGELAAAGRRDAQRFRHRGSARSLRAVGRGGRARARHRHVRLCAVGPHDPHSAPGARPPRHQAALLRGNAGTGAVRLRAQGFPCRARLEAEHRRRRGRRLSAPCLHCAAAHDLPRSIEAPSRSHPDPAPGQGGDSAMLLGPARHRGRRPGAQRSGAGRERGGRAARCAAARLGQAADDRRRAARGVSFRRHQFLDRRGVDAGAEHAAGEDLLDRLSRARL